jgi:hypothetical protein
VPPEEYLEGDCLLAAHVLPDLCYDPRVGNLDIQGCLAFVDNAVATD